MSLPLYGAIEAGGTKFICAVGPRPQELLQETRIATTTPTETLAQVVEFFRSCESRLGAVGAFGIAAFGPLDLDPSSPGHGRLLKTPKPGWSGADLLAPLRDAFARPIGIDTDVNAAAMAEAQLGAGCGLRSVAYVTVGTGIGGGFFIDGRSLRGVMHPEIGHLPVRRDPRDLAFAGCCPFHGDCVEGLASGTAIMARWNESLDQLAARPAARSIIAGYLGQLSASIALTLSSQLIVFGGGVMQTPGLVEEIRRSAARHLNGYLPCPPLDGALDRYIVPPGLGTRSGLAGAMLLAKHAVS
jgi:fructokinase